MGVKVRERKGAWWVQADHHGKRKSKRLGVGAAGKQAATTFAAILSGELAQGNISFFTVPTPTPTATPITFAEIAREWLRVHSPDWKRGTVRIYANLLSAKINPLFGQHPMTAITPVMIERWWTELRASGFAKKSLANARHVLRGVCQRAVMDGVIPTDPSLRISGRLGRVDAEVHKVEWLTGPDLTKLLTVAEQVCPRFAPLLLTMASAGLRVGEAAGLQIGDLDPSASQIHVRRSVTRGLVGSPKNGTGRVVDVPAEVMKRLLIVKQIREAEAAVAGTQARWLFVGGKFKDADGPLTESPIRRALHLALKRAGIRQIRVHDLRHTYATLAIKAGVPLLTVSRQLGHADISTTANIYGHAVPGSNKAAADALAAILAGKA